MKTLAKPRNYKPLATETGDALFLEPGSHGDAIESLQTILIALGCGDSELRRERLVRKRIYDAATQRGVVELQQLINQNLPDGAQPIDTDGKCGPGTRRTAYEILNVDIDDTIRHGGGLTWCLQPDGSKVRLLSE